MWNAKIGSVTIQCSITINKFTKIDFYPVLLTFLSVTYTLEKYAGVLVIGM